MVTWVMSTFHEIGFIKNQGVLLLFDSMRNEMQKMRWTPWISHSMMEGRFEFRWRSMVDQSTLTDLVVDAPTTDIVRDLRGEDPILHDADQGQEVGLLEDVVADLDQDHLEEEATALDLTLQEDEPLDHAQEVETGDDQDPKPLQIDQDLVLVRGKGHSLIPSLPGGTLLPHAGLNLLAGPIRHLHVDLLQKIHPNHPDKKSHTMLMLLTIRMMIDLFV